MSAIAAMAIGNLYYCKMSLDTNLSGYKIFIVVCYWKGVFKSHIYPRVGKLTTIKLINECTLFTTNIEISVLRPGSIF